MRMRRVLAHNRVGFPEAYECSAHGAHSVTSFTGAPRLRPGLFTFGPELKPGSFDPRASSYMEPILMYGVMGFVLFMVMSCAGCCFCYRRYQLGMCGDPFPTVKRYTPRQRLCTMCVAAASFSVLAFVGWVASYEATDVYHASYADLLNATLAIEGRLAESFSIGRSLLETALTIIDELDRFDGFVDSFVDASTLRLELLCISDAFASLPNSTRLLQLTDSLREAEADRPPYSPTVAVFDMLSGTLAEIALRVPPISASLLMVQQAMAAMPDLPLLADRMADLNHTALNASGLPTSIAAGLVALNSSLSQLPNLSVAIHRLGRVHYAQTLDATHICANLPDDFQPGDRTECDELRAQLSQVQTTLETTQLDALMRDIVAFNEQLGALPDLGAMVGAMNLQRQSLESLPNLTTVSGRTSDLFRVLEGWDAARVTAELLNLQASIHALQGAQSARLLPELALLQQAESLLACIGSALDRLRAVNTSLLRLPPSSQLLAEHAADLVARIHALPPSGPWLNATRAVVTSLAQQPALQPYIDGVAALQTAVVALPAAANLTAALLVLESAAVLPPLRTQLLNVTASLQVAVQTLPSTDPFYASLVAINRSRAVLPTLIEEALAAIVRYDNFGDDSDMGALEKVRAELSLIDSNASSFPDDLPLRTSLATVEGLLGELPPVWPDVAALQQLQVALDAVPPLSPWPNLLGAALSAATAIPDITVVATSWFALNATLRAMPDQSAVALQLSAMVGLQAKLPDPPSLLVIEPLDLVSTLGGIKLLVAESKGAVVATQQATLARIELLELGFLGENQEGSSETLKSLRAKFDTGWLTALTVSYATPVALSAVAVVSAALQAGSPALHAGQALLVLLPFVWWEAVGVELPLVVAVQDGCADLEPFVLRVIEEDGRAEFDAIRAPAASYMNGCVDNDAMADVYLNISLVTRQAHLNIANQIDGLQLRPAMKASSDQLALQTDNVLSSLSSVNEVMACGLIYELFQDAKRALCCDFGYAVAVVFVGRMISALVLIPAIISAIAGYKRFRRTLWGPYATIQALEVGAYL